VLELHNVNWGRIRERNERKNFFRPLRGEKVKNKLFDCDC